MFHQVSESIEIPLNDPADPHAIMCAWRPLRDQLLRQWNRLTPAEVDEAGPDRRMLALLLQRKCGVDQELAENYLHNFERTLPME